MAMIHTFEDIEAWQKVRQLSKIVKGSTAEIESQLYVALDNGYINKEQFMEATSLTSAVKSLLSGFVRYLKNQI